MNMIMRYLIHELVHVFQHEKNEGKTQKKYKEYLDDPDEKERLFLGKYNFMQKQKVIVLLKNM